MVKSYQKLFQGELADELEKHFPKGECKERGRALVFNAMACVIFKKVLRKALKDAKEKYRNEDVLKY